VPFYDRSSLIEQTIETLRHALIEEIALVTLAHIIFLWHFRSILIVTLPLPISILISFILMQAFGITSNIMSLSGIATAIGVLVVHLSRYCLSFCGMQTFNGIDCRELAPLVRLFENRLPSKSQRCLRGRSEGRLESGRRCAEDYLDY
jgi:AcrB/AcrD/AcrF family